MDYKCLICDLPSLCPYPTDPIYINFAVSVFSAHLDTVWLPQGILDLTCYFSLFSCHQMVESTCYGHYPCVPSAANVL